MDHYNQRVFVDRLMVSFASVTGDRANVTINLGDGGRYGGAV